MNKKKGFSLLNFRKGSLEGKENKFLSIDIGTEAVKALIFRKNLLDGDGKKFLAKKRKGGFDSLKDLDFSQNKTLIFGSSTHYFERYGVFDSNDFEKDVFKKAISKSLEDSYKNFIFFAGKKDKKRKTADLNKWPAIISLSPDILRARIFLADFQRKNSGSLKISKLEEENIFEQILERAKKTVSLEFKEEKGILPDEIKWTAFKVIRLKIDGYQVPKLYGYKGKKIEVEVLTVFLPKEYFERIEKIISELGLKIFKIVHLAEVLPLISKEKRKDGIFIDIGGEVTQIFLVKSGFLEKITEFKGGGKMFSLQIADMLGVDEETARMLKEEYADKLLSSEADKRIKEIISSVKNEWYMSLKNEIKKISSGDFFSPNIFIFGGGSLLPEIKGILEEKRIVGLNDLPLFQPFDVNFIYPDDLGEIKDLTSSLKSPKDVPPLLMAYSLYVPINRLNYNAKKIF